MTQLTLARREHLEALVRLVADFHRETGVDQDDATRRAALAPLLEGSPHGAVYLAGPTRAPVGYAAISFGWSLALGGLEGFVDELYVRPGVRGRGIGTQTLQAIIRMLASAGLRALHLEVTREDAPARALCARLGFAARNTRTLMSRPLAGG